MCVCVCVCVCVDWEFPVRRSRESHRAKLTIRHLVL